MNTVIPIQPLLAAKNKCGRCTASTCCTYLTQELKTPRSMEDFDLLLWQISHRDTQVYKDEDGWFLLVNNRCRHLFSDGRCGIYETRPQVCRDHSTADCEAEGVAGPEDFDLFFADYEALEAYCHRKFKFKDCATPSSRAPTCARTATPRVAYGNCSLFFPAPPRCLRLTITAR